MDFFNRRISLLLRKLLDSYNRKPLDVHIENSGNKSVTPANSKSHANYEETPYISSGVTQGGDIRVDPPLPARGRRRSRDSRRAASPWRKQLIVLMVDDSGSMQRFEKAKFATEAARELISRCYIKNPKMPCFDIAVFAYGDMLFGPDSHILRPVNEINPDELEFKGEAGGTKMNQAVEYTSYLMQEYEAGYYRLHEEPERVPPPLIFLLSDGYNGDGNPVPAAEKLKNMKLSIGISPILVTVGIEKGDGNDVPNVPMMQAMATKTSTGHPLYFDVTDLPLLVELISTTSSSAACTPDEVFDLAMLINPEWKTLPAPAPKRLGGPGA
jgi:uncharacterized protein YegL